MTEEELQIAFDKNNEMQNVCKTILCNSFFEGKEIQTRARAAKDKLNAKEKELENIGREMSMQKYIYKLEAIEKELEPA